MLITKTSPVGIDFMIQQFQTSMHARLMEAWELDPNVESQNTLFKSYGRCYRNKRDSGYIAEIYTGKDQYQDAYWEDGLHAVSFFGTSATETHKVGDTVTIHQVFFVDLKKLKPSILHRADEEVRKQVQMIAQEGFFGFRFTSTEIWLDNVLREYSGMMKSLTKVDMHPVHCFRLNYELNYNKNNC